jgi:hypothetical protein
VQTRLVSEGGAGGNAESFPKATAVFVPKGEMVIIYLTMFINMCVYIYRERERWRERLVAYPIIFDYVSIGLQPKSRSRDAQLDGTNHGFVRVLLGVPSALKAGAGQ